MRMKVLHDSLRGCQRLLKKGSFHLPRKNSHPFPEGWSFCMVAQSMKSFHAELHTEKRMGSVCLQKWMLSTSASSALHSYHFFKRHIFSQTDAILEDVSVRISKKDLTLADLPIWLTKLSSFFYEDCAFHIPCVSSNNRRLQIMYDPHYNDLAMKYNGNIKLKILVNFVETNRYAIDISDYPVTLNVLMLLLDENHHLRRDLQFQCSQIVEQFSISHLTTISQLFASCKQRDNKALADIISVTESRLTNQFVSDLKVLNDIIDIYRNTRFVVDKEQFYKAAQFVVRYISDNISDFKPIEALNTLCKFPFDLHSDLGESVREMLLKLEVILDSFDFNLLDLDQDSCCYLGTEVDRCLGFSFLRTKRWNLYKQFIRDAKQEKFNSCDVLKLCFLFYGTDIYHGFLSSSTQDPDSQDEIEKLLLKAVDGCDNYWLIQLLKLSNVNRFSRGVTESVLSKLSKSLEKSGARHLQWILDETKGDLLLLLSGASVNQVVSDGSSFKALYNVVQNTDTSSCQESTAIFLVHKMQQKLQNNTGVTPLELSRSKSLMRQLDVSSLMYFLFTIQTTLMRSNQSVNVRRQSRQLMDSLSKVFDDKLSSDSFIPPANLLPWYRRHDTPPSVLSSLLSSSHVMRLVQLLTKLTAEPFDTQHCLRAITVLDAASTHHPCYEPEVFENLLEFMYCQDNMPLRSFLLLVKLIAMSGYQPQDLDKFERLCLKTQAHAMQQEMLRPLERLQLMYHMSLLDLYDNLPQCLSFDAILDLDREINLLKMFNPRIASSHRTCLHQLLCNAAIECPQLSVQQFVEKPVNSREPSSTQQRMCAGVRKVFKDSPLVATQTSSPYGHSIDALVCFDWDGVTYNLKDPHNHRVSSEIGNKTTHRLCFLHLSPGHFCKDSKERLTGTTLASIRQLQLLGYNVIEISYFRLLMMDLQSDDEALDEFLKSKIQQQIGIDGMFDFD